MSVPEVKKGDFFYRDTFFVDLGENKRHPRATASELKELLLPKRGNAPVKDQVAHFYEAQLIHYGLPRSKDKNTAKVRLTNAITGKALSVPAYITQVEADLKKEYAAAVRKSKGSTKQDAGQTPTKGRSKKAANGGTATTISVKVGDTTLEISQHTMASAKKTKATKKATATKTPASKPKASAPASAARTKKPKPATTQSASAPSMTSTPRPKQTARRARPFTPGNSARNPLSSGPQQVYTQTPVSFHHENDIDMDDAPPAYESINFNERDASPNDRPLIQISGSYGLYDSVTNRDSFAVRIDKVARKLWGRFSIGAMNGVVRSDDISGLADGETVSFGWRAEDEETGDLKFGRGCNGSLIFDGQGNVDGRFWGLDRGQDVEFEGSLLHGEELLDVDELRRHWDRFPRIAYGRG